MRAMKMKRKSLAIVLSGTLALAAAGGAYAYWTTTGNGVGAATTGTSVAFTVTSANAVVVPLTPGGPSDTVEFTVTNPSTGVQHLSTVAVTVAGPAGAVWASDPVGCTADDYTVGTPDFIPGDIAAAGTISGTVTLTMINRAASQDACKTVSVPLYIAAS